jgi:hypothetical protein
MSEGLDPVRRHLDAETWLANAEEYRAELAELEPETTPSEGYAFRVTAVRDQSGVLLSSAIQLAELHRAMARIYWDVTPQRYALAKEPEARSAEEVQRLVREQLKADDDAHQGETLRPGADPEPVAEGELWTTGNGWFYYSVSAIPAAEAAGPGAGYVEKPRWLLVRHYAQVLRWSSEQGTKPLAYTWSEVADHSSEGGSELRRPTAEERAAFYGPEPDSEVSAQAEHEGPLPPASPALFDRPEPARQDRTPISDMTLQGLTDAKLEEIRRALKREQARRGYTALDSGAEQFHGPNW